MSKFQIRCPGCRKAFPWDPAIDLPERCPLKGCGYVAKKREPEVDEDGVIQQQTTRYYISKEGVALTKIMPPLKGKTEWRHFAVEKGWKVCVCNDLKDAVLPIDYSFYIDEVDKLVLPLRKFEG
jgi:hypothetical protein